MTRPVVRHRYRSGRGGPGLQLQRGRVPYRGEGRHALRRSPDAGGSDGRSSRPPDPPTTPLTVPTANDEPPTEPHGAPTP